MNEKVLMPSREGMLNVERAAVATVAWLIPNRTMPWNGGKSERGLLDLPGGSILRQVSVALERARRP